MKSNNIKKIVATVRDDNEGGAGMDSSHPLPAPRDRYLPRARPATRTGTHKIDIHEFS